MRAISRTNNLGQSFRDRQACAKGDATNLNNLFRLNYLSLRGQRLRQEPSESPRRAPGEVRGFKGFVRGLVRRILIGGWSRLRKLWLVYILSLLPIDFYSSLSLLDRGVDFSFLFASSS